MIQEIKHRLLKKLDFCIKGSNGRLHEKTIETSLLLINNIDVDLDFDLYPESNSIISFDLHKNQNHYLVFSIYKGSCDRIYSIKNSQEFELDGNIPLDLVLDHVNKVFA